MMLSVPGCDEVLAETATESTLEAEIDLQPLRCTVGDLSQLLMLIKLLFLLILHHNQVQTTA